MKEVGNTSYCAVLENLGRCTYCLLITLLGSVCRGGSMYSTNCHSQLFCNKNKIHGGRLVVYIFIVHSRCSFVDCCTSLPLARLCPLQSPTPAVSIHSCLLLLQPCTRTDFTRCCLRHSAPAIWNSLPGQHLKATHWQYLNLGLKLTHWSGPQYQQ